MNQKGAAVVNRFSSHWREIAVTVRSFRAKKNPNPTWWIPRDALKSAFLLSSNSEANAPFTHTENHSHRRRGLGAEADKISQSSQISSCRGLEGLLRLQVIRPASMNDLQTRTSSSHRRLYEKLQIPNFAAVPSTKEGHAPHQFEPESQTLYRHTLGLSGHPRHIMIDIRLQTSLDSRGLLK